MDYPTYLRPDQWERIAHALPGKEGSIGRPVEDNRRFMRALSGLAGTVAGGVPYLRNMASGQVSISALNAGLTAVYGK